MSIAHPARLDDVESSIMEMLRTLGELSAADIADRLADTRSRDLRSTLAALSREGWLVSRRRRRSLDRRDGAVDEVEEVYSDRVLLRYFTRSSEAFIASCIAGDPRLIVDLGCGPGHCTRLLKSAFPDAAVVGIDHGSGYLALANRHDAVGIDYVNADITRTPFPSGPCDVLFCRFCMSHLVDHADVVRAWADQLKPGGVLLLEETESTCSANEVFRKYLNGGYKDEKPINVGSVIDGFDGEAGLHRYHSAVVGVRVETPANALLFRLNVQAQKADFRLSPERRRALERMETELKSVYEDASSDMRVDYAIRQVAYRKTVPR